MKTVAMPHAALHTLPTPTSLTDDNAHVLAETFKLLGDPSRLRILIETLDAPCAVGDIATSLGLSPSLVSHHLRLLRAARLVRPERRGKHVYYSLHDAHIAHVLADMVAHINEDETDA